MRKEHPQNGLAFNDITGFSGVIPMFKALHCEEHGQWMIESCNTN